MNHKYILLIDQDGVISDWSGHLEEVYRNRYPNRPFPSRDEVSLFYIEDLCPEEHRSDVTAITREIGFYRNLKPIPGALEALKDMKANCQDFLEPFICSSPEVEYSGLQCHSEKADWIDAYLGSWWTKRLILTKDKTLIRGHLLIDDKPEIEGVMTPTWNRLIFDQPYNRGIPGVHFAWDDWSDFKQLLRHWAEDIQAPKPEPSRILIAGRDLGKTTVIPSTLTPTGSR